MQHNYISRRLDSINTKIELILKILGGEVYDNSKTKESSKEKH